MKSAPILWALVAGSACLACISKGDNNFGVVPDDDIADDTADAAAPTDDDVADDDASDDDIADDDASDDDVADDTATDDDDVAGDDDIADDDTTSDDDAMCVPDCGGMDCGDNGCGESCGTCEPPEPMCDGDDLVTWEAAPECVQGTCSEPMEVRTPCVLPSICVPGEGECCEPDCDGRECNASDGCGGECTDSCRTWTKLEPDDSPSPRRGAALSYDSTTDHVLLFGGDPVDGDCPDAPPDGWCRDTWEWDGSNWTKLAPLTIPPALTRVAMVYDAAREVHVLLGEVSTQTTLAHFEFDAAAGDWLELTPDPLPDKHEGSMTALTYDSARRQVVLFAGSRRASGARAYNYSLYFWGGDGWTELINVEPPSNYYKYPSFLPNVGIAYHGGLDQLVSFGGWGPGGVDETYLLDLDDIAWSAATTDPKPPRLGLVGLTYAEAWDRVVMLGGCLDGSADPACTRNTVMREFDGTYWLEVEPPGTQPTHPPDHPPSVVYDASDEQLFLFGGWNGAQNVPRGETWVYGAAE